MVEMVTVIVAVLKSPLKFYGVKNVGSNQERHHQQEGNQSKRDLNWGKLLARNKKDGTGPGVSEGGGKIPF